MIDKKPLDWAGIALLGNALSLSERVNAWREGKRAPRWVGSMNSVRRQTVLKQGYRPTRDDAVAHLIQEFSLKQIHAEDIWDTQRPAKWGVVGRVPEVTRNFFEENQMSKRGEQK